ncbi:hypothetical protein MMC26_000130 [Xylographa opegraphella]|nr:hypothetical protein [Xylographa opegraphella]
MPEPTMPEPDIYGHISILDQTKWYRDYHNFRTQQKHDYDSTALELGWQMFCILFDDLNTFGQDLTTEGPYQIADNILVKLPNLRELIFDSCNTFRPQSEKWIKHFHVGLTQRSSVGVQVFQQALKWLAQIGARCSARPSTLRIGLEIWEALKTWKTGMKKRVAQSYWNAVYSAVEHLRHLELHWCTAPEGTYDGPYEATHTCYESLQENPRLHEMIAAAPNLEQLTLSFRPYWHAYTLDRSVIYDDCEKQIYPPDRTRQRYMARLEDCFRRVKWSHLRSLKLWGVEARDNAQLTAFFRRHALIQHLDLQNMGLRTGSWITVFEAIREPDRVATCILAGEFYSCGPPVEIWDLEMPSEGVGGVFDEKREKRRADLQEWVCNRPRRPRPATGTTVEWRRIWGLDLDGVGFPYTSPLRWHLKP